MIELRNGNFDQHGNIINSPFKNGIVVFLLRGCPHCEHLRPVLQKLSEYNRNNPLFSIAFVEHDPNLIQRITDQKWPYQVRGFPTLIQFVQYGNISIPDRYYQGDRSVEALQKAAESTTKMMK
jgi:thiol-disulfide isomerase/thioredoxin